jgi:hypothetical protein
MRKSFAPFLGLVVCAFGSAQPAFAYPDSILIRKEVYSCQFRSNNAQVQGNFTRVLHEKKVSHLRSYSQGFDFEQPLLADMISVLGEPGFIFDSYYEREAYFDQPRTTQMPALIRFRDAEPTQYYQDYDLSRLVEFSGDSSQGRVLITASYHPLHAKTPFFHVEGHCVLSSVENGSP